MELSSDRSQDEDRIMQRQLYRAGQSQPAPKSPPPPPRTSFKPPSLPASLPTRSVTMKGSAAAGAKPSTGKRLLLMLLLLGVGYYLLYGSPSQRKKVLVGLGVAAWLFLLGSISYCLCLPDLEEASRTLAAMRDDPNVTPEQRREKFRETVSKLTPTERRQVFEGMRKERERKENAEILEFLKLSPKEQITYVKKRDEERRKRWEQFRRARGNRGNGGPWRGPTGNRGAGMARGGGGPGFGGPGGGGPGAGGRGGGGGPGGGGPAMGNAGGGGFGGRGFGGRGFGGRGGGGNRGMRMKSRLDSRSPEARAGRSYQRGLSRQLGLGRGRGFGR